MEYIFGAVIFVYCMWVVDVFFFDPDTKIRSYSSLFMRKPPYPHDPPPPSLLRCIGPEKEEPKPMIGLVRDKDGNVRFDDYEDIPEVFWEVLESEDWKFIGKESSIAQERRRIRDRLYSSGWRPTQVPAMGGHHGLRRAIQGDR